jgi:hypothetical protein
MANVIESKFKIYEEDINQHQYFNKLVDERALFEVYPNLIDYETLDPARRQISSYSRGNIIDKDGNLMRVFESNARVVNTKSRYIQWRLYTNPGDIRATFIKNYEAGNEYVGRHGNVFEIGLDVEWFGPNDLLIFEGLREVPLLVISEAIPDGTAWKYEVRLFDDNPSAYFPLEYLDLGTRLLQVGSLIGEATMERGNIHFGDGEAFIEFEVPMTRMGWEMKVTDNAHLASKNYRLQPRDQADVKTPLGGADVLVNSLELKFMAAVNHQKDLWLTYGRSAGRFAGKFLDGITEKPLQAGPGLFEFLESSRIYEYSITGGGIDMFREHLPSLWHDKVDPENRRVDIYTGTGGLILWQKWCEKADVAGVLQTAELNYGNEEALFSGRKGVAIGARQYRAAFIEPFGLVRVHYLPFLDSEQVETRTYNGLPVTSYQFIVFNFGYGDGRDSNVHLLKNEDVSQYGYAVGTWSPMGPVLGRSNVAGRFASAGTRENAYWYIHEEMFGLVMKDPGFCIWYQPALV